MTAARATLFVLCLAVAALASAALTGCGGEEPPRLEPLTPGAVVVAFGDSLTSGVGAPADQSYPAQLARLTGLTVHASGVPGETSSRGLTRLPRVLERLRPRLVILCHGGNDLLRGLPPSTTEANLRAMVDLARARGAQVLLVGVPQPGLRLSVSGIYPRVAREARVPLEADILTDILSDSALKADPIHPNAAGYARMAERLAAFLTKNVP